MAGTDRRPDQQRRHHAGPRSPHRGRLRTAIRYQPPRALRIDQSGAAPDPRSHRDPELRLSPWRQTEPRRPQLAATPLPVSDVMWQTTPKLGTISATGLYQAPTQPTPHAVVVTA